MGKSGGILSAFNFFAVKHAKLNILGESITILAIDTTPTIKNPLVVDRRRLPPGDAGHLFHPGAPDIQT